METSIALVHAAKTRAVSRLGGSTVAWSSQAVSMVASRNSSLAASARRKPTFVVSPRIAVSSSAATSARRADSRSGPCTMILPSIGSYDVLTTWPGSRAWSTRAWLGQRTIDVAPAWGRKPPNESSAYTRASMAWPLGWISAWSQPSGMPIATISWPATRSRSPRIISVTGCSTWSRVFISRK